MKKGDIILIGIGVAMLAFAIVFILVRPKAVYVAVYEDGVLMERYPLNKDTEVTIRTKDGHWNVMQIKDGTLNVIEADCPNQICVNTVPVTKTGESILCLPHKISFILEQ